MLFRSSDVNETDESLRKTVNAFGLGPDFQYSELFPPPSPEHGPRDGLDRMCYFEKNRLMEILEECNIHYPETLIKKGFEVSGHTYSIGVVDHGREGQVILYYLLRNS